ncbi:MAG: hypothetical protein WDM90_11745 [Ferruginibacter sp.]
MFNKAGIDRLENITNCNVAGYTVTANTNNDETAAFNIVFSGISKKTTIIVLPRSKALQATKIETAAKEVLLVSDGITISDNENLTVEKTSKDAKTSLELYLTFQYHLL